MNVSLEDLIDELDPEERNRVEILTQALIAEELAFRKLCDARERVLDAITQGHPVTPEHIADLNHALRNYIDEVRGGARDPNVGRPERQPHVEDPSSASAPAE